MCFRGVPHCKSLKWPASSLFSAGYSAPTLISFIHNFTISIPFYHRKKYRKCSIMHTVIRWDIKCKMWLIVEAVGIFFFYMLPQQTSGKHFVPNVLSALVENRCFFFLKLVLFLVKFLIPNSDVVKTVIYIIYIMLLFFFAFHLNYCFFT